ncbi:hypothetical protein GRX01_03495 [Halobaculum sp. WSA2]|uniref:Uncharacterized protein n=1 Tax=Halobaculum saliterrae TaxID=2073113 RepID=A0A6B0SUR2_9EURY|nr:hypothetical protein [Halobaculum saliterrae]MXR40421.1 hypothetical protein [Halobaculum saliterrae]
MRRRGFLRTGLVTGLSIGLAGCNANTDDPSDSATSTPPTQESDEQISQETVTQQEDGTEEQPTEEAPTTSNRYFFKDETGALGHLADDNIPDNSNHVITNEMTDAEFREMQRNDRQYPEGLEQGQITMSVDKMITRAEEIYQKPTEHLDTERAETLGVNLTDEDDEITFTRALIKASQEAGVDSSGLANIVVANIAEDAINQIQPGFNGYKLSTLPATEAIDPASQGHAGGVRETEFGDEYGNSGFRHMPALLQYQKNGETQLKYAEQTDAIDVRPILKHAIRDPENSIYRASLDQETVNTTGGGRGIRFPEHYVTALDYTKARELEASEENVLGFEKNGSGTLVGLGDQIDEALRHLIDDMGVTGYNNNEDLDLETARPDWGGTIVSEEFGDSLENHITNPDSKVRQYTENVGRGLYLIRNEMGMSTSLALIGTLANPEFLPTDQDTVNQIRRKQAYDEVRERIVG